MRACKRQTIVSLCGRERERMGCPGSHSVLPSFYEVWEFVSLGSECLEWADLCGNARLTPLSGLVWLWSAQVLPIQTRGRGGGVRHLISRPGKHVFAVRWPADAAKRQERPRKSTCSPGTVLTCPDPLSVRPTAEPREGKWRAHCHEEK